MADSFLGFNTSSSRMFDEGGGGVVDGSEEEYDALNDETFGACEGFDWENQHSMQIEMESSRRESIPAPQASSLPNFAEYLQNSVPEQIEASLSRLVLDDDEAPLQFSPYNHAQAVSRAFHSVASPSHQANSSLLMPHGMQPMYLPAPHTMTTNVGMPGVQLQEAAQVFTLEQLESRLRPIDQTVVMPPNMFPNATIQNTIPNNDSSTLCLTDSNIYYCGVSDSATLYTPQCQLPRVDQNLSVEQFNNHEFDSQHVVNIPNENSNNIENIYDSYCVAYNETMTSPYDAAMAYLVVPVDFSCSPSNYFSDLPSVEYNCPAPNYFPALPLVEICCPPLDYYPSFSWPYPNYDPALPPVEFSCPNPSCYLVVPPGNFSYPPPNYYPADPPADFSHPAPNHYPADPPADFSYPPPNYYPADPPADFSYPVPNYYPADPPADFSYPPPNYYPADPPADFSIPPPNYFQAVPLIDFSRSPLNYSPPLPHAYCNCNQAGCSLDHAPLPDFYQHAMPIAPYQYDYSSEPHLVHQSPPELPVHHTLNPHAAIFECAGSNQHLRGQIAHEDDQINEMVSQICQTIDENEIVELNSNQAMQPMDSNLTQTANLTGPNPIPMFLPMEYPLIQMVQPSDQYMSEMHGPTEFDLTQAYQNPNDHTLNMIAQTLEPQLIHMAQIIEPRDILVAPRMGSDLNRLEQPIDTNYTEMLHIDTTYQPLIENFPPSADLLKTVYQRNSKRNRSVRRAAQVTSTTGPAEQDRNMVNRNRRPPPNMSEPPPRMLHGMPLMRYSQPPPDHPHRNEHQRPQFNPNCQPPVMTSHNMVEYIRQTHPILQNRNHHPMINRNAYNNQLVHNYPWFNSHPPQRHYNNYVPHQEAPLNGVPHLPDADEYADLMTAREKQWLVNIQLMQVATMTPYLDDYYYTVINEREAQKERDQVRQAHQQNQQYHPLYATPRRQDHNRVRHNSVRLSSSSEDSAPRAYVPTQFENSLGKLQCGSVVAPRKIIDADVVQSEPVANTSHSRAASVASNSNIHDVSVVKRTKQVLMDIEGIFVMVLRLEELNEPLAISNAIVLREREEKARQLALEAAKSAENSETEEVTTNLFLKNIEAVQRKQKETKDDKRQVVNFEVANNHSSPIANNLLDENKAELLNKIFSVLLHEDRIPKLMSIRKGKKVIRRFLAKVPVDHNQLRALWSRVFKYVSLTSRKDNGGLDVLPIYLRKYIQASNGWPPILELCAILNEALDPSRTHHLLTSVFAMSCICMLVEKAIQLCLNADVTAAERQWSRFLKALARALKASTAPKAQPIKPLPKKRLETHIRLLQSRSTLEILQRGKPSEFSGLTNQDFATQLLTHLC